MPLYDYRGDCGESHEALGKPDVTVPCRCGRPGCTMTPLPGAPAFSLKGPGWTDKGRKVAGKASTS